MADKQATAVGNKEHAAAVGNVLRLFVHPAFWMSMARAVAFHGWALFSVLGDELLAWMDEQPDRQQKLATPAPTQAPGDSCFGWAVTFTCCCTSSPVPYGSCTFFP